MWDPHSSGQWANKNSLTLSGRVASKGRSRLLLSRVKPMQYVYIYYLGCTGTPFLAEYQYRVRAGYGYTYHTGTKVPNTYQRAKLKFQKYGYVWVRKGYVWVPYGYVFG